MERELLERMPFCDIGQLSEVEKRTLAKLVRQGRATKTKWYWNSMCIGRKKTWYYAI